MNNTRRQIDLITRDLVLGNDQLEKVSCLLLNELILGLSRERHQTADVKMFPTFVRDVPNGHESGRFLALDLGGTNFRVLLIELNGFDSKMDNQIFAVPQEVMLGTGERLFDHIADCIALFVNERGLIGQRLPLGFTFSFPCKQESLTKSRLVQWTKGFDCSGAEGEDVVQLLRQSIAKHPNVEIDVMAVLNDSTGTLMSCAHKNSECRLAVIVGTGFNVCYMEQMNNIEMYEQENCVIGQPQQMIINTECPAFGDNGVLGFIRTQWDEEVDMNSLNKGEHLFEKMISGMYLGEIVRRIAVDLIGKGLLLSGQGSDKLLNQYSFTSEYISRIDSESMDSFVETRNVLKEMDIEYALEDDLWAFKLICQRVSSRSAHLVAAGVSTLLKKMKRKHTTVAMDGSVYRYHPHFHYLMESKISELIEPEINFDLILSEDGSGRGAALVAAVAVRQIEESRVIM